MGYKTSLNWILTRFKVLLTQPLTFGPMWPLLGSILARKSLVFVPFWPQNTIFRTLAPHQSGPDPWPILRVYYVCAFHFSFVLLLFCYALPLHSSCAQELIHPLAKLRMDGSSGFLYYFGALFPLKNTLCLWPYVYKCAGNGVPRPKVGAGSAGGLESWCAEHGHFERTIWIPFWWDQSAGFGDQSGGVIGPITNNIFGTINTRSIQQIMKNSESEAESYT